jgi:hypothetical protein
MPIRALPNGPPHTSTQPGRHRPESVVVIDRNRWSPSTGTGGRNRPKPVVAIDRNRWSPSLETTGRLQPKQLVAISRCAHGVAGLRLNAASAPL